MTIKTADQVFGPIVKRINPDYSEDSLFNIVHRGNQILQLHITKAGPGSPTIDTKKDNGSVVLPESFADLQAAVNELGFESIDNKDSENHYYVVTKDGFSVILVVAVMDPFTPEVVKSLDKPLQEYIRPILPPDNYFVVGQCVVEVDDSYVFFLDVVHSPVKSESFCVMVSKPEAAALQMDGFKAKTSETRGVSVFEMNMLADGYSVMEKSGFNHDISINKQIGDWVFMCNSAEHIHQSFSKR